MKRHALALVCALLGACGGGGGGGAPALVQTSQPSQPGQPASPPALSATTLRTLAGGAPIRLTATGAGTGAVNWKLADTAPGTLSAASGTSVTYTPPAGGIDAATLVPVTATQDGAAAHLTLAVTPDPGPAGLTRLSWREPGTETTPTMETPQGIAADLDGNVYVLLQVVASPSRRGPPRLVRIAPSGAITGVPVADPQRINYPSGFAIDRAGNILIAERPFDAILQAGTQSNLGPAILKITPAGAISVLAGTEEAQTGAMTDGKGSNARFLAPRVVGIDYDDNVYVLDANETPRRIAPDGAVTTLKALPAGLYADLNGNTYAADPATHKLVTTTAGGTTGPAPDVPYCLGSTAVPQPSCFTNGAYLVEPIGGASFVVLDGGILRLVVPH